MKKLLVGAALGAVLMYLFDRTSRLAPTEEPLPRADDESLALEVESEILGARNGRIDVNAENGVVYLRGDVVGADAAGDLVERARRVKGVRDVENMLRVSADERYDLPISSIR